MKRTARLPPAWTIEADRRFARSALGKRLVDLLDSGSTSQRRLAEYVLRDPIFVATRGIEDLAKATSISTATISRFVRELGLGSFADFRSAVAETVRDLIAPVAKFIDRFEDGGELDRIAETSLETAAQNLAAMADPAAAQAIHACAQRIAAAPHVYVMGFGLSAHLAAILALGLQPYRASVFNTVQFGGTEVAAGRLSTIDTGDLLIVISFPRYAADLLHLVRFARDNGARIMAITDSSAAPVARFADDLLLAPAQHPVLSSSNVAALALIEALVSDFMLSDPVHLERARKLTQAIANYLVSD